MNTHCSEEDLQFYQLGQLPVDKRRAYEDHLLECLLCTQRLLATVTDEDIEQASQVVPERFTEETMARITEDRHRPRKSRGRENPFRTGLLFYYTAAAVLAVAFVGSGVFQSFIEATAMLSESTSMEQKTYVMEDAAKWPDNITDSAAQWIDGFGNYTKGPNPHEKGRWSLPVPAIDWFEDV